MSVTMEQVFEALEEAGGAEKLWNALRKAKRRTVSKKVGDDTWEFQGKKGHWRTVNGSEIFFPDDGGEPLGMPKAMKKARKKDTSPEGLRRELSAKRKAGKI
ncbi:MAG: hypothetical protein WC683_01675 [bacterium]